MAARSDSLDSQLVQEYKTAVFLRATRSAPALNVSWRFIPEAFQHIESAGKGHVDCGLCFFQVFYPVMVASASASASGRHVLRLAPMPGL